MAENFTELMKDINPQINKCNKHQTEQKQIHSCTHHNENAENQRQGQNNL